MTGENSVQNYVGVIFSRCQQKDSTEDRKGFGRLKCGYEHLILDHCHNIFNSKKDPINFT